MTVDINFMVGGEAGQGVQSAGFLLARALSRGGYHIFADQDYESRVRGGHNFFRLRAADSRVNAIARKVDVLVALNKESIELHRRELAGGGVVIFDGERIADAGSGRRYLSVPMERLAKETAGSAMMANTVALGAVLGVTGYDFDIAAGVLKDQFRAEDVAGKNIAAARAGYSYVQSEYKGAFGRRLGIVSDAERMMLNGNEAMSLGAIAAGCKFMAAYPMTPATTIMEYFASKSVEAGLVMVHAEDEIAAINMAIGAGYAGVRSMTATSGSGFCLMVEGLGLAGITETPVVIINAQRPGPAVGLPTRTEQGDLSFVIYSHHGDFPRAVLAPSTVEDAFWLTVKAFNLAEKYQIPVILLTDHYLASSYQTIERYDLSGVTIDRGLIASPHEPGQSEYKRHLITKSGISPRAFPGLGDDLVVTDSDEHGEEGHLIEDAGIRTKMMQKRLRKTVGLRKEMSPPARYGPKRADVTLIGWGSTYGAICEAVDILNRKGAGVNALHLTELFPFPAKSMAEAMKSAHRICVVEGNATGQLSRLITAETGREADGRLLKFDGRPFTPDYIAREIGKEYL